MRIPWAWPITARHDHDLLAHAINERSVELGANHPVPYLEDGDSS